MRPGLNATLLITWHSSCDYPLARYWLKKYGIWFDKIIIYFSQHNIYPQVGHFVQSDLSSLSNIIFLDPVEYEFGKEDWRAISVKRMFNYAKGTKWIASIEQDMLSSDWPRLLIMAREAMNDCDLFGWMNPTNSPYIHPAFFFATWDTLEKADYDFTPHPEINGSDHFAMITYKAKEKGLKIKSLPIGEVSPDSLAFHLGGINQNYLSGIKSGIFHRPDIFSIYNHHCLWNYGPDHHLEFRNLMMEVKKQLPYKDEEGEKWNKFFT